MTAFRHAYPNGLLSYRESRQGASTNASPYKKTAAHHFIMKLVEILVSPTHGRQFAQVMRVKNLSSYTLRYIEQTNITVISINTSDCFTMYSKIHIASSSIITEP